MSKLRLILLFPLGIIYGIIIRIRNYFFDFNILKSKSYDIPIISIGNLTVGGTGKTPITELVIRTIIDKYKTTLLSRGYRRATKGVIVGNKKSSASEIGDEPRQLLDKFNNIDVVVAEKRIEGMNRILNLDTDVVVMDDAYQHRYVKPGFSILVADYTRPMWYDTMLPAGNLREPMSGKNRADIIIVNKCPEDLSIEKQNKIIKKIKPNKNQDVFFSSIHYKELIGLYEENMFIDDFSDYNLLIITGIAHPHPFYEYVDNKTSRNNKKMRFPDHYDFKDDDIQNIKSAFNKLKGDKKIIITTEKDAVRLKEVIDKETYFDILSNIYYIPIEIFILNNKTKEFYKKIIEYVTKNK